ALRRRGVGRGQRVGVFHRRGPRMIAALLGCHRAGAAYVPLDPAYPAARNAAAATDAGIAVLLADEDLRHEAPAGEWQLLCAFQAESDDGEAGGDDGEPSEAAVTPNKDDPAYLLYTSGSTGRPKGVVVDHANLRASNAARERFYGTGSAGEHGDAAESLPGRYLLLSSLAFDSSVAGIFWTLAAGGTLVIPSDDEARDARRLCELAARERVTTLLCVPSLWEQMLRLGGEQLTSVRCAIVAGEACPPALVGLHRELAPQARLFNEYGPTEATVWATACELTGDKTVDLGAAVPIGRPIPGVETVVLDGRGLRTPVDVPGELWIRGPTVTRGYWNRDDETARHFQDGPPRAYRTGDLVRWDVSGRLVFLGRTDSQVKVRGVRIELGEVEAGLRRLPGVLEAAAVAVAADGGAAGPRRLVGCVVLEDGAAAVGDGREPAEGRAWRAALARLLPEAAVPSRRLLLEALPRLANGKVDRRRLEVHARDALSEETRGAPGDRSARGRLDPLEHALCSLWQGLLDLPRVEPDENFFELGGHSLLVVELAEAIERDHGVELTPAEVFAHPTVRALARHIASGRGSEAPRWNHLYPIQPSGRAAPLVFAIPHELTPLLARHFRGERPVYGLRGVGLRPEGNLGRWRSMRELGAELADEIARRFPESAGGRAGDRAGGEGGVVLGGYSFGASMAAEAARQLGERGARVQRLFLIAPMPLDVWRRGPLSLQLPGVRRPVGELGTGEALRHWARGMNPLTRAPYVWARRWLLVEPWRRLVCLRGKVRRLRGLPLTEAIQWADVRVDRFRLHRGWRPQRQATPTTWIGPADVAATWRPWFTGAFEVLDSADPHDGPEARLEVERLLVDEWFRLPGARGAAATNRSAASSGPRESSR
ncbi:MAG: amino acid adenylation domain-containing protein, partial [Acidobacteria bacterium]